MVLLTIVAPSNPHTVYFDYDIEKPNYIRLLSATIYNSWHNLKTKGDIYLFNPELKKKKKQLSGAFSLHIIILIEWQKKYTTYSQPKRSIYKPK